VNFHGQGHGNRSRVIRCLVQAARDALEERANRNHGVKIGGVHNLKGAKTENRRGLIEQPDGVKDRDIYGEYTVGHDDPCRSVFDPASAGEENLKIAGSEGVLESECVRHTTSKLQGMSDPLSGLLAALDLTDTGARTSEDIFTGPSQWQPLGRVFGGQVLAQSITAAIRTVADDRFIHSTHGYFLRPGDSDKPITFSVDRIHDGRSFSTRRTQAYQNGLPILSLIASFQVDDEGLEHQVSMPLDIPDPESLPSAADTLAGIDHPVAQNWATQRAFDMRHVTSPVYFSVEGAHVPHQALWFRAIGSMPDDPNLHRAALAYASDYSILEPILRAHGIAWGTPGLNAASLDHAMWWHRYSRVDEWLLYVQESPTAKGGRGLTLGQIFNRQGELVASVAQEGMVRVPSA
jgi:acyl-CoA thioesterase-2